MNQTYPCYKLARKAAGDHATRLVGKADSQTMSINTRRREIMQQWKLHGRPETYRMYFRWECDCNGH